MKVSLNLFPISTRSPLRPQEEGPYKVPRFCPIKRQRIKSSINTKAEKTAKTAKTAAT